MEILTGPKGGKYYIGDNGKKHYIRKDQPLTNSSDREKGKIKYIEHIITVADYEHSGDLDHEIAYIKSVCPQARNFKSWEEEDYEAEADYEQEYGECDESIYQGYVSFEAPESWNINNTKYGIY